MKPGYKVTYERAVRKVTNFLESPNSNQFFKAEPLCVPAGCFTAILPAFGDAGA
jgi:hypothetical protein